MSKRKRLHLSASLKSQPSFLILAEEKKKCPEKSRWCSLPLELMVQICTYLSPKDKRNLFQVCSHWSAAANVSLLWKQSWVSLKTSLMSWPKKFWDLVKLRSFDRVHLCHNNSHFRNDLMSLFHNIPQLEGLHVEFSFKVDPSCFTHLFQFKYLTTLRLDFLKCYTSTLVISNLELKELPQLKSFLLAGISDISRFDVSFLSHPLLMFLSLETCGSFREGDTNELISYFPNLCELHIKGSIYYNSFIGYEEEELDHSSNQRLTHIDLSRTSFNGLSCRFPKWFQSIESLNLSFCQQNEDQLAQILSQLNNLKCLNLTGNFCSDETFTQLIHCTGLLSINLCMNNNVTIDGLSNLGKSVGGSIKHLNLSHCVGLSMKKRNVLNSLSMLFPIIQSLHLCGWNMTSKEVITLLLLCKTLRKLHIDRSLITDSMHSEIRKATNSKTLLLSS